MFSDFNVLRNYFIPWEDIIVLLYKYLHFPLTFKSLIYHDDYDHDYDDDLVRGAVSSFLPNLLRNPVFPNDIQ